MKFAPDKPNGVLFDAAGNVVFRFAQFSVGEEKDIPEYVDPFHGIEYCESDRPGEALGRPIEAHREDQNLPDPTARGEKGARPKHDVENPQADNFWRKK